MLKFLLTQYCLPQFSIFRCLCCFLKYFKFIIQETKTLIFDHSYFFLNFWVLSFFKFFIFCIWRLGVGPHTHASKRLAAVICMQRFKSRFVELALSFHLCMGSGDWILPGRYLTAPMAPFHIPLSLLLGHILSLFYKCKASLLQSWLQMSQWGQVKTMVLGEQ